MPPYEDITQTGPQTGSQLKKQNDEFSMYFGNYKEWGSYKELAEKGFNDDQISRLYRNAVFKQKYGARLDFDSWAKNMTPEQRDNILLMEIKPKEEYIFGQQQEDINPLIPRMPSNQELYKEHIDDTIVNEALKNGSTVETRSQFEKLYNRLSKEAKDLYPSPEEILDKSESSFGKAMSQQSMMQYRMYEKISPMTKAAKGLAQTLAGDNSQDYEYLRYKYIRDNLKLPQKDNPYQDVTFSQFKDSLDKLSTVYNKLNGSKWLNLSDKDIDNLYNKYKDDLNNGKVWKVEAGLDKDLGEIVEQKQPGWFESGGDELVHSRSKVFFEQAAAGAVENLMDAALVPAGLIYGGVKALVTGNNYWQEASYLPSLAHDVANNITGDNSIAYGNSISSALANSGYTIGTMAIDAALMAIPSNKLLATPLSGLSKASSLGKASETFAKTAAALNSAKATRIFGTAKALNFGITEGTIDALDVRQQIIDNAEQQAASMPMSMREAFMKNAIHEANAAYGRTVLEESLVVNAGTLLGLGFLGSIVPKKAINFNSPRWQRALASSSKGGQFASFLGHTTEGIARTTVGELLEEYAQGMSSGINKARAEYNINNYAEALHYSLGSEYLNGAHLGFMQGLERFSPRAWVEMDPENLTKQVILSTLLFRGLKLPGVGKTRSQINIDNNTKIGKLWDNIRKFSPVQTGIGQIIADAKSDTYDVENSLHRGFSELISNPDIVDVMQDQAALTDIGIQMQQALDRKDITQYQKMTTAYQVAQGIMLANALDKNTRFGRSYIEVLNNRADFNKLSTEDKEEVLQDYLNELQIGAVSKLSREDQINIMINTAKQSLNMIREASQIIKRLKNDPNTEGQDIRPLVFAELMNQEMSNTIDENFSDVISSVNTYKEVYGNSLSDISDSVLNDAKTTREAYDFVIANYFTQRDHVVRSNLIDLAKKSNIGIKDVKNAIEYIESRLEGINSNIHQEILSDLNLNKYQKGITAEWNKMYDRVRKGESVFDEKSFLERIKDKVDEITNSPERQKKRFIRDLNNAKSLSDTYKIYNDAINDDDIKFDVESSILSSKNSKIKGDIKSVKRILSAQNSIKASIAAQQFDEDLMSRLFDQIDLIAQNATSVDALYDISKYDLTGVRPDLIAEISGKIQDALNSAKGIASHVQTVDSSSVDTEIKQSDKTDLSDRDINTTPPVNEEPLNKLTVEDATNLANEINSLMEQDDFDLDEVGDKIQKLQDLCPDGYQVLIGGTKVVLKKKEASSAPSKIIKDNNETDISIAPKDKVVVNTEDIPEKPKEDTYPDNDPRSITSVAAVTFEENGKEYYYPIRDEDVKVGDNIETEYSKTGTGVQGRVKRITLVNIYNQVRAENNVTDEWTIEKLATYPRPVFIDRHSDNELKSQIKERPVKHQQNLNNSIAPTRNEISPEALRDKSDEKFIDKAHANIDKQLDDAGAFEYRNSGALEVGDKILFVVSEEEMPDGQKEVVIWEVTKPKDKEIPSDSKFKGMQVLGVLDQTNMSGNRKALIDRIRSAYNEANRPESFLYDKEQFDITSIVDGLIPFNSTNPIDAQSDATIETTNMKKSFTKVNGVYGSKFFSKKTGKFIHVPVILRQTERRPNSTTENITTRQLNTPIEVIKHQRSSQSATREVMLLVPTPTGWKASHSVYILKRGINGATDRYKQAIEDGAIGKLLIQRIQDRLQSPGYSMKTNFSDIFAFDKNCSEYIKYYENYNQVDLGYSKGDIKVLLYAHNIGNNKWVITNIDNREVINDNDGKGFTLEDISKEYLKKLVDDNEANVSLRINMRAIKQNSSILDALIDDGMLWTPNSIGNRVHMENVGFNATIDKESATPIESKEIVEEQPSQQISAPIEKPLTPESVRPTQTKQEVDIDRTDVGSHIKVKRAKKKVSDIKPQQTPNQTIITPSTPNTIVDQNRQSSLLTYEQLNKTQKQQISDRGMSEKEFNNLTQQEKENMLNCID